MVRAIRSDRRPGAMRPGHTAAKGTFRPPSYMVPFPARRGPLSAPTLTWPPLSEVKTTRVLSARPVSRSVARTRPMPSSMCSMRATSFARFLFSLGIREVGEVTAQALADAYPDVRAIAHADEDELQQVPDIGPVVASRIRSFFQQRENNEVIEQLLATAGFAESLERRIVSD